VKTSGATRAQTVIMSVFAFSCFGLLLFLWISFGGTIPLKPKGYRVEIAFPEATTLASEADVRVAGVSIGKVVKLERDPHGNRTLATLQINRAYAPLHKDAKAMLRQKTLLGETYVEMTLGHNSAPKVPEGGKLPNGRVEKTVELDEVLELFPEKTRADFRRWMANSSDAIDGRGQDLNDALGNLSRFSQDGSGLLETLDRRREALKALVANTGTTFGAITRDENGLRSFIADTSKWFKATASEKEALAQSIQIFRTFLRESRATLDRVAKFSVATKPLVDDLGPVARDLKPTLADLRAASPDLQTAFRALPALTKQSRTGLPALSRVLTGLTPVLNATGPFLAQLNPILSWLQLNQGTVANFISGPGAALAGKTQSNNPNANGHVLPQLIVAGSQTLITPTRSPDNRGNTYLDPQSLNQNGYKNGYNILSNWDCKSAGGEHKAAPKDPGCFVQAPFDFQGKQERFPHVLESDFKDATK
jgi:phospholipid/cholesterol/gamma-HCH transport system substrate-binding protein